ncbi:MAG: NADPH:quinone reductase [Ponticaulis sp.]|nr:NADPH:quinone reductase [Ponticaulis sp.]
MSKRIFIWVGHPRETSLASSLADAYTEGALLKGAEVRRMNLHDMSFDPDLTNGYHQRKDLEPCLEDWRENILWADHLAWFYPQWWGGMPAKMKGVLDRAFLPGFAMNYHTEDPWWDKLLKGRSADVFITADAPAFFDRLAYGRPAANQVTNLVLKFSGITPVRTFQFGIVKSAGPDKIRRWLNTAQKRAHKIAG